MSYKYDVFLSFTGSAGMEQWVETHLYRALMQCMEAQFGHRPEIYSYRRQEPGTEWPKEVKEAHLHSRFLVPIWAPPYFRSPWCMAEWKSMCERATHCGVGTEKLIYPIKYGDGEHFPEDARNQYQADFTEWAIPDPVFRTTAPYTDFYKAVSKIAKDIDSRLRDLPAWQANFPIVEPGPMATPVLALPRY